MKNIVVATDGSDASQLAIREGLEIAKEAGAAVTVVTARQPISFLGAPYDQRELSRQLAHARAALDRAKAEAEAIGIEASYEIREGDPADEILRIAADRQADLVVLGSRGLGAIRGRPARKRVEGCREWFGSAGPGREGHRTAACGACLRAGAGLETDRGPGKLESGLRHGAWSFRTSMTGAAPGSAGPCSARWLLFAPAVRLVAALPEVGFTRNARHAI